MGANQPPFPNERVPVSGPGLLRHVVRPNGGLISLFGVLHFGEAEMPPLSHSLMDAFDHADIIAFETDLQALSTEDFSERMSVLGSFPEGENLQQMLSHQIWEKLLDTACFLGLDFNWLRTLKPWYCSIFLTSAALNHYGLQSQFGVDIRLFQYAQSQQKETLWLETPERQLDLLAGVADKHPNDFMLQTLKEIADMPAFSQRLLDAWNAGNEDILETMVEDGFSQTPELQGQLLKQRNLSWFKTLDQCASNTRHLMCIVGTGHLVGENSLLRIFIENGYQMLDDWTAAPSLAGVTSR